MATAFNATSVTTTAGDLFNTTTESVDPCSAFAVTTLPSSGANLLINIPGLHKTNDWFGFPAGGSHAFRAGTNGSKPVRAKAASGTITASGGVVALVAH